MTLGYGKINYLIDNGNIIDFSILWSPNNYLSTNCRMSLTASGIYKGSSARESIEVSVSSFYINEKNEILVDGARPY